MSHAGPKRQDRLGQNRDFRVLWVGETVSLFGAQVSLLALPLTALIGLRASTSEVGAIRFIEYAPFLLFALPLGVLSDRCRRRPLLVFANAARVILIGSVPIFGLVGSLTLGQLYIVAFGVGLCTVLYDICLMTYLPTLVDSAHLVDANARVSLSMAAAQVSGPGLAGLLIRFFTAPVSLVLTAGSYVFSAISLLLIRSGESVPIPSEHAPWQDLRTGLSFLFGTPALCAVTLAGSLYNLAWSVCQTAFLIYAQRQLGIDVGAIGVTLAVGASGGVLGAAVAPQLSRRFPFGRAYTLSIVVASAPALLVPVVGGGEVGLVVVFALLFFLMDAGLGVYNVLTSTMRQSITPDHLLGRVAAGYRMLVFGGLSLGGLVVSIFGDILSSHATLWIAAGAFMVAMIPIALSPIPRFKTMPSECGTELRGQSSSAGSSQALPGSNSEG